jgi:hypothetical protein
VSEKPCYLKGSQKTSGKGVGEGQNQDPLVCCFPKYEHIQSKNSQTGLHQNKIKTCAQQRKQQSEEAAYRVGENFCQLSIRRGLIPKIHKKTKKN